MVKTYAKGRRFEYKVRDYFKKSGYFVVRQAKSSFPDLIAVSPHGKVIFIECKAGKYFDKKEEIKLRELAKNFNSESLMARPGKKEIELK